MSELAKAPIRVLLIEDNPDDADLVAMALDDADADAGPGQAFALAHVDRLAAALRYLEDEPVDAILLDLSLPDGWGLDTFRRLHARVPSVPILVLSGLNDEEVSAQAVRDGAQDYLVKGEFDHRLLTRALRYAIARKRAEEDRADLVARERAARARAEAAEAMLRERDAFLTIAAHELKTPMTGMHSAVELLLRCLARDSTVDEGLVHRTLATLDLQVDRLARLVNQLLDMVILQEGRFLLERTPINLTALVRRVADRVRPGPSRPEIVVTAPEVLVAEVDSDRLAQVIMNLLDNAVRFGPPGGRIDVDLAAANGTTRLVVRDHGPGVRPEHRPHLFERFHRAHADDHRSGMGLGLYLCREIVALHGGQIAAEFPPDGGTRVVVSLPRRVAGEAITPSVARPPLSRARERGRG